MSNSLVNELPEGFWEQWFHQRTASDALRIVHVLYQAQKELADKARFKIAEDNLLVSLKLGPEWIEDLQIGYADDVQRFAEKMSSPEDWGLPPRLRWNWSKLKTRAAQFQGPNRHLDIDGRED